MSGICDTCKRNNDCRKPMDGMNSCRLYVSGKESNYKKLFGTPEKVARMIADTCTYHGSFDCSYGCLADEAHCGCGNYDALFEWLRGDADFAEGGTVSETYIDGGESGPIRQVPRANVIFEGQKLTFDEEDSAKFAELVKGHFRKLAGLKGDA